MLLQHRRYCSSLRNLCASVALRLLCSPFVINAWNEFA